VGSVPLLGLAVLVQGGALALAWSHARRVASLDARRIGGVVRTLKKVPSPERLAELGKFAAPGTFERALVDGAQGAPDGAGQVAALNLVLSELEHELTRGSSWPKAALRLALLGAGLVALVSYLVTGVLQWSLTAVAIGGVGAIGCAQAGRVAGREVLAQRAAADELVAMLFGRLPPQPRAVAARADRRSRRRRAGDG
jgi:hypothetical protein